MLPLGTSQTLQTPAVKSHPAAWNESSAIQWLANHFDWGMPAQTPPPFDETDWLTSPTSIRQYGLLALLHFFNGQPDEAQHWLDETEVLRHRPAGISGFDWLGHGFLKTTQALLYMRQAAWVEANIASDEAHRYFAKAFPMSSSLSEKQLITRVQSQLCVWQCQSFIKQGRRKHEWTRTIPKLLSIVGYWGRCPSAYPVTALSISMLRIACVPKKDTGEQLWKALSECQSLFPGFAPVYEAMVNTVLSQGQDGMSDAGLLTTTKAQAWLQRAIQRFPNQWEAYAQLAECSLTQDDTDQALLHYQKAVLLALKESYPHHQLGRLYSEAGMPELATDPLKMALVTAKNPSTQADCCHLLGQCYLALDPENCMDLAEHLLVQACELDPSEPRYTYVLAIWLFHQGRYDEAEAHYRRLVAATPGDAMLTCSLGYLRWLQGDIHGASELYQQAISIDPEYDVAYNNLGVLYLEHWKDADTALELFAKAVDTNYEYAVAHYNLGRAYRLKGQRFEAAASFQWARELSGMTHELDDNYLKSELQQLFQAS